MKKKNNKGFTLIELMAVVIILIIILLIAFNRVKSSRNKAQFNAMKASAASYVKAINDFASTDNLTSDRLYQGTFSSHILDAMGIKLTGKKPDIYVATLNNFEVESACFKFGKYKVEYTSGKVQEPVKGTCENVESVYAFEYKGSEDTFIVPATGRYKLEVWGAQGGQSVGNNADQGIGGYGAYAYGDVYLTDGEVLYINVGGAGEKGAIQYNAKGGYNGGGNGKADWNPGDNESSGGGGGATSIAKRSGLLSSLSSNQSDVLIVAAGGGGSSWYAGGNGGGYMGVATSNTSTSYPTQTGGYMFGQGYSWPNNNTKTTCDNGVAGAGGGWYGGYSQDVNNKASGTGGSSYIGYSSMLNRGMVCNNCSTSGVNEIATRSVTTSSENPTSNTPKAGNGYAKITLIDEEARYPSHLTVYYDNGQEINKLYDTHNRNSNRVSFLADRITMNTSDYRIVYTDTIDLSKYNSVIVKKTSFDGGRTRFYQYPERVNDAGQAFSPTWVSLGDNTYVADLSSQTRNDLHFYIDQFDGSGTGDIFFIGFSTKSVEDITADHSFVN